MSGGATALVDGMSGIDNYATGEWIGFLDGDVTAVIDLGASNGNTAGKTVAGCIIVNSAHSVY